jgi:hypothetical protein
VVRLRRLQIDEGIADVAQPLPRVLLETTFEQRPERGRHARRQVRPGGILREHSRQEIGHGGAGERPAAGQELEEHAAERPDVGAFVDRLSPCLFRAHVGSGAEHDSSYRADGGHCRLVERRRHRGLAGHPLRQAEVEHLDRAVRGQLDVGRLEIAVDDAAFVGGVERRGELARDLQRLRHGQRAAHEAVRQRRPLHELHDERRRLAVVHVVDGGDVGMIERGEHPGLALEAGAPPGIQGMDVGQQLDGDVAAEPGVACPVDLSHAPRPDGRDDLIRAEARP